MSPQVNFKTIDIDLKNERKTESGAEQNCRNNEDISDWIHNWVGNGTEEWAKKDNKQKLKTYSCSNCDKLFENPSTLEKHEIVHLKDRPFTCSLCNQTFKRVDALKRHKKIHSYRKKYLSLPAM